MGHGAGSGTPYATASLIVKLAEAPHLKSYVNGKLVLAGVDESRVSLSSYLDALYAIVVDAPHEALEKYMAQIVTQTARARPDRETWGLLPEHRAMSKNLTAPPPRMQRPGA